MRPQTPVKSATAFRTISEVSEELDIPQHVLRFWETRFPQIRPLKRGGGRRYYRPEDVELLRRIRSLLYHEGYTIKGVQRLLREHRGTLPAAGLAPPPPGDEADDPADTAIPGEAEPETTPALPDTARAAIVDVVTELKALRALLTPADENAPER
ncbi:MerR family transcriptional regulator [Azospirillum halopraeferens]|uniref:MerR family transcriptional regulator n=1 Tax=Azospirillum halopraeferens TaxID=34010 RepID=UPI0004041C95|nr:MerR family transcriptional regulator [Azospirillum halopraeferens]